MSRDEKRRDGELMTVKDLATELKVAPKTIYGWVERGEVPFYRFGRALRFRLEEVVAWGRQAGVARSSPESDHDHLQETRRMARRLPLHRPPDRPEEALPPFDWTGHDQEGGH